nr:MULTISPECIES: hypothetical protein [unclassified Pseudomonas]
MSSPLLGIGMDSNRSQFMASQMSTKMRKLLQLSGELPKRFTPTQLKHATIVQIGDAFSAGLGVWGLKRSDNYKQAKTFAIGLYEETE